MNRYYIILIIAVLAAGACKSPQQNKRRTYTDSNVMVNDTFFVKRSVINDSVAYAIFIDTNRKSEYYNNVYNFDYTDMDNVVNYLEAIGKKHIMLEKFNTYGLVREWRPVYQLHSKYYVYKPSDSGYKGTKYLTHSLFMVYSMDGYSPIAMQSFTKINDDIFNIKLKHGIPEDQGMPTEVNIYIIDKKTKLAVWEYKTGKFSEYQLMVPMANARQYPIVVITSDNKQPEYDFEVIDFKKLIAGVTKNQVPASQ
jgi:hypothetical protein